MGFLTSLYPSANEPRAVYRDFEDFWYQPLAGSQTQSGSYIGLDSGLKVSAIFQAIRLISESLAKVPLHIFERGPDGESRTRVRDHNIAMTLGRSPNPYLKSFQYRVLAQSQVLTRGNHYSQILLGRGGTIGAFNPLNPDRMEVKKLPARYYGAPRRVGYVYNDPETGTQVPLSQEEVFHLRGPMLSTNDTVGMSTVGWARETIGGAITQQDYSDTLFRQGALHRGLYSVPGSLTPEQHKTLMEMVRKETSGPSAWGSSLLLSNGATWTATGMTAADAEFILERKFNVLEIARWFNIQPHLLRDLSYSSYCLPASAQIFTAKGPKSIAEIKAGERVWSRKDDGSMVLSRVLESQESGCDPIIKLRSTNRTLRLNAKHRVLTRRMHREHNPGQGQYNRKVWTNEYIPAGELKVGDTILALARLPQSGTVKAPTRIASIGFMEFLGFYSGNGWLDSKKKRFVAVAHNHGAAHMDYYRSVMRAEFVKYRSGNFIGNQLAFERVPVAPFEYGHSTRFGSKLACEELIDLGITGLAKTKIVPEWIFQLEERLRLAYLRGFVDSDGSVDKKGRISFCSASEKLLTGIRHLCLSVGVPVTNLRNQKGCTKLPDGTFKDYSLYNFVCSNPGENIRIGSHQEEYLRRLRAGKPFLTKTRRYPRWGGEKFDEKYCELTRIHKIEIEPAEPVYDLTVESTHNFIADGVITHNSNHEQESLEFAQITMLPHFVNWEETINVDLLNDPDFFSEFLLDAIVRTDIKTRYDAYGIGIEKGFLTPNEVRQKENWNALEGLDRPRISLNIAMIDEQGDIMPPPKPPGGTAGLPGSPGDNRQAYYDRLLHAKIGEVNRMEVNALKRIFERREQSSRQKDEGMRFYDEFGPKLSQFLCVNQVVADAFSVNQLKRFLNAVEAGAQEEIISDLESKGQERLLAFVLQDGLAEENGKRNGEKPKEDLS